MAVYNWSVTEYKVMIDHVIIPRLFVIWLAGELGHVLMSQDSSPIGGRIATQAIQGDGGEGFRPPIIFPLVAIITPRVPVAKLQK